MKNRISDPTKWPLNIEEAGERCERDLEFTQCLLRIGASHDEVVRITKIASDSLTSFRMVKKQVSESE